MLSLTLSPYRVIGSSADDLAASVALLGPREGAQRFAGRTRWELAWSCAPLRAARGPGFRAAAVEVTVHARVELPEWLPPRGASPSLVAGFARYRAALLAHERQHVAIALRGARALRRALMHARAPSVDALAGEIDALGAAATAVCRAAEQALDRESDHGRGASADLDLSRLSGSHEGAST